MKAFEYVTAQTKASAPGLLGDGGKYLAGGIDLLGEMKRTFARCPKIQKCYYVAGEWDFVLVMIVRHMEQYTS